MRTNHLLLPLIQCSVWVPNADFGERRVMVLIDPIAATAPDAAPPQQAPAAARAIPHAALARLAVLRSQAIHDLGLLQFLARAPQACLILLAAGAGALVWTRLSASSASLEREFVWASSVLAFIVAITGFHILNYARGGAPMPLDKAATRLRWLLFCTGIAWGSGAFLVMPDLPSQALAVGFAAVPCLALTLLLGERAAAFAAPVTLATASAACLGTWPSGLWVATVILAASLLLFTLSMLQREMSARRDVLSASTTV